MKQLLCFFALIFALTAHADNVECPAATLVADQTLAEYTMQVATADGHKEPKYVVGVLKVESKLGESKHRVVKQGSSTFYGVGQVSIGAAKAVMKRFSDLWNDFDTRSDEELKARLILDDRFNASVTSKYLLMMGVNKNAAKGIAAYNLGEGGVQQVNAATHPYTRKVMTAAAAYKL
jgi:hypothetical protein